MSKSKNLSSTGQPKYFKKVLFRQDGPARGIEPRMRVTVQRSRSLHNLPLVSVEVGGQAVSRRHDPPAVQQKPRRAKMSRYFESRFFGAAIQIEYRSRFSHFQRHLVRNFAFVSRSPVLYLPSCEARANRQQQKARSQIHVRIDCACQFVSNKFFLFLFD